MTQTASTARIDWVAQARALEPVFARRAARHDREGAFVRDNYDDLKRVRFFSALVPEELGGGGASYRELCDALRVLARGCPSTALSVSMHTHLVAATVCKWRGQGAGEPLLRRVADEQTVLLSTGATDWISSNGELTPVEGGYRLNARKVFGSGGPAAQVLVTSARCGDDVCHFAVPASAPGVTMTSDWDAHGMRGTGSNTILLEDVFVPEASIALRRPGDRWHPVWSTVVTVAMPLIMSVYVGIAEAAAAKARELASADGPHTADILGEMVNELTAARIAWDSMVANVHEFDFVPDVDSANRALVRKTICAQAAVRTVEKAMEAAGGRGFFVGTGLERLLRDVRAGDYHPLQARKQVRFTGRLALGLEPV
jgi:alkylation response protein AidB-like acyl-CoA dehydrogenase